MLTNVTDSDLVLDPRHAPTDDREVIGWVERTAALTRPDNVVWCDDASRDLMGLVDTLLTAGALARPTPGTAIPVGLPRPVRERTLIRADAFRAQVAPAFEDCMRGRQMYVIPFAAGVSADDETAVGVQVTDSAFVAAVLLASYATISASALSPHSCLIRAVHSVGRPLPDDNTLHGDAPWPQRSRPWLARFREQRETWAFGSAYEPRLASVAARPLSLAGLSEPVIASVA